MDMVENGELYELVEKWKELYKISMEDFNDLNSYMDDFVDTELIYTYDDNEKVYIFSITTDKEMMNKEMKSLRKLVEIM